MSANTTDLKAAAAAVLARNDIGGWTRPAPALYPHQWLWDSCFIAIGLSHVNPARAATELRSLLRGQWQNGMLPHMIYSRRLPYNLEGTLWGTGRLSPRGLRTSGISQPPMLAIAAQTVAAALPLAERHAFIKDILPGTIAFHEWIYRERDPHNTGLAAVLHSWESGMDDIPYWTEAMDRLPRLPLRWRWLREYRRVRADERSTTHDLQHMLSLALILKHYRYDSRQVIDSSSVVLQDLVFNSVLASANESLERLAEAAGETLPEGLHQRFAPTRRALESLWDSETHQYYTRDVHSGQLVMVPSIATFMPLFAGTASPAHADHLRHLLVSAGKGEVAYPVPTVPSGSPHFEPKRFWRGPVWINMNWFIIRGLERYGFTAEAGSLRDSTLKLVSQSGFREYFNPLNGDGLGGDNFSWTAALTLDLLADA